jgi:hypothetical protein
VSGVRYKRAPIGVASNAMPMGQRVLPPDDVAEAVHFLVGSDLFVIYDNLEPDYLAIMS